MCLFGLLLVSKALDVRAGFVGVRVRVRVSVRVRGPVPGGR